MRGRSFLAFASLLAACADSPAGPARPQQPPPEPLLAADVTGGAEYACAIVRDTTIRCTGSLFTFTPPITDFASLGGGADHACGVRGDGSIRCWGQNVYAKLNVPGGSDYREVTAGLHHTCALRGEGSIVCWGLSDAGQTIPPKGTGFHAISAAKAAHHTCALDANDAIVCWGENGRGQTAGLPGDGYRLLVATESGGCAVDRSGTLRCWGDPIPGLPFQNGITALSAGRDFVCAVRAGAISCWGPNNVQGVLSPPEGSDFLRIGAGFTHACALRRNGRVKCWGAIRTFPDVAE
jgi:alpha-tubulin suppressor-like RCC1 family protein